MRATPDGPRPVAPSLGGLQRVEALVVALCVAVAVALLVATLANHRSAAAALASVSRGQADALVRAVARTQWPSGHWDATALEGVLAAEAPAGLRCIAAFDERMSHGILVGACSLGEDGIRTQMLGMVPGELRSARGLLRAIGQVPAGWPARPPDPADAPPLARPRGAQPLLPRGSEAGRPPPPRPREGRPPRRPGPPPIRELPPPRRALPREPEPPRPAPIFVEFEPRLTHDLEGAARRNLQTGVAASLTLAGAAIALWRLSRRARRVQATLQTEQRLAALGEMSAVLAHEIRNPLASMKGHAQLLVERLPSTSPEQAKAARLVREAQRLERLTSDLLSFVRAPGVEKRRVDPSLPLRAAAEEVDAPVRLDLTEAPEEWLLDADAMRRALANLLQNAAHVSPEASPPVAQLKRERGRLVYVVRDRGPGIPEDERERIFEPFHTTKTRGTGLGLAVVDRIVRAHGGRVTVTAGAAGGSVFRVELPRA